MVVRRKGSLALEHSDERATERAQIHVAESAAGLYRRVYTTLGWRVAGTLSQGVRAKRVTLWLTRAAPAQNRERLALLDMEASFVIEALLADMRRHRIATLVASSAVALAGAAGAILGVMLGAGGISIPCLVPGVLTWACGSVGVSLVIRRVGGAKALRSEKPYYEELGWIGQRSLELL